GTIKAVDAGESVEQVLAHAPFSHANVRPCRPRTGETALNTTPNQTPTSKPSGNASARYLFLFLVGLAVGAVATVMVMRALEARKDPYPDAVMNVMSAHVGALYKNVEQNRCAATDTIP